MADFNNSDKLDMLENIWGDCDSCDLGVGRHRLVMWRGNPGAKIALIGEAPGESEDLLGKPFVGRAGNILDVLVRRAGLDAARDVFVANMVACRPPNNRKPTLEEMAACAPRLQWMLKIVKPDVLVLLGATAARLAGIKSITRWRGELTDVEVHMWNGQIAEWPAVPTFHPSYLLRNGNDRKIWDQMVGDLKLAKRVSDGAQKTK